MILSIGLSWIIRAYRPKTPVPAKAGIDIRNEIFELFKNSEVNLFSQKTGWEKANKSDDLSLEPEGYVFISGKKQMIW